MNTSSEEHTTTSSSNVLFPLSSHGRTYRLPQCADELPMAKLAVPGGGGAPEDVRRRGGPSDEGDRPPQYTLPLRGADVLPGPDTEQSYRIYLSLHGLQMAVLEVLR